MLAGCTVDELAGSKDGQIPVRLSVSQEATVTRAADGLYTNMTGFDGGEQVEVYVNSSDKHAAFTVGAPDGDKKSELTGTLYYPTTGDANLYAVYPAASTESHTVKYDQTTPANYKASDLMYASKAVTQANKTSTQELQFNHQLVKLKVVIVKAADVSQVTQVMMNNVKRKATVSLSTSALTLSSLTTATGDDATEGDNILIFSGSNTSTEAQTYAVVFPVQSWSNQDFITVTADGKTATYKLTKDNFAAGSEYTLTLNINATALNNTVSITSWTGNQGSCEVQPTVTEKQYVFVPEGAIPGLFTINADGDQVFFSKGNLQYDGTNWKFADNQYDVLGANGTGANGMATGYPMDLFTWGNTSSSTAWGSSSAYNSSADLSGDTDWGSRMGSGWRTLSKDEWKYVFGNNSGDKRSGATVGGTSNARYTEATINTDGTGVNGVILFPDGATFAASEATWGTINAASAWGTQCTTAQWTALEAKGCVFLPAAGIRGIASVNVVGSNGYYWSSTAGGKDYGYNVKFGSDSVNPADFNGHGNGHSVRLVRPVPSN